MRGNDDAPKVLMVTEKPALAKTIAEFLSGGRMRRRPGTSRSVCLCCAAIPTHFHWKGFL